ncbi:MAG: 4Fe-4S binding protein [Acidobacteria bacterium]|nr:4Fe-4S binding protein [Acidobacteriota bacterium]
MKDVFHELARKLDRLPQGYPATGDGLELRILRKVFSEEDAAVALRLRPFPETAARIARRLGVPVARARARLDDMAQRGQIGCMNSHHRKLYLLVPFVVGIYEFQLRRLDAELAEMMEAYLPHLTRRVGGARPALARVVPIHATIDSAAHVLDHEDARRMVEAARVFRVAPCICRKQSALRGRPCRHPEETCLTFATDPTAYDGVPEWGRVITREEALGVLDLAEREGLVHCTYNFRSQPFFVCNCCSCCCGFLRGLAEFRAPHMLARSNYAAAIDAALCANCGACVARCPVGAIAGGDASSVVAAERCIGCGVCAPECPRQAIRLFARPAAEQERPPRDIVDWSIRRTTERDGTFAGVALRGWLVWQVLKARAERTPEPGKET